MTQIGTALGRYKDVPFGLHLTDRLLHAYIIGQTGTGKSTLLGNMGKQDAEAGIGFCLIDPHGDLAASLSATLTVPHRYWHVADPACPYGYNPLTRASAHHRALITSGLIDTLKKQWADAWRARMEYLLRYAILALLEQPQADIRDIVRLYVEKDFRRAVVARVTDEQTYRFWTREFPNMNYQNAADGVAPIANKLGAFLANPVVRKVICEPDEPLRFRQIMDQGEILLVNLAKGQLGGDSANVLGGLIVTSFMHAAFSRSTVPEHERRPFMLYVDEFHAFTTQAFASMLSEARKYGLGLTLAHQHIGQAENEVYAAILGNVGSVLAFRVGVQDAPVFERQFQSVSVADLIWQPNYRVFAQMMVQGLKSPVFSAQTWPAGGTAALI